MNHNKFKDNITSYLSGDLSGDELEEFEIHFFNWLGCRDYLLMQKAVYQSIKEFVLSADESTLENLLDIESVRKKIYEEAGEKSISGLDMIKALAKNFIKQYYPAELPNFDLAWRVFYDFDYESIGTERFSGALAASGIDKDFQDSVLPDIIICLANSLTETEVERDKLDVDAIQKTLQKIATKIGTAEQLINQLKDFIREPI
jgi:hypothetical protein